MLGAQPRRRIGAASRVKPDGVKRREVSVFCQAVAHRDGVKGRQIVGGQGRRSRIAVDGLDCESECSKGHGVSAQSTAQIGNRGHSGALHSPGVVCGHTQPSGLFQSCFGKKHALCEVSKFGLGLPPQSHLFNGLVNSGGGVSLGTKGGHQSH